MSEKIAELLESILDKKPNDAQEIFESIMKDKLRATVEEHSVVVAEGLFEQDEEVPSDEDIAYDPEDLDEEELTEGRKTSVDHDAATELKLFADNDSELYHGHRQMIHKNQMNHAAKGRHDRGKAVKAWEHHARFAADKYARDFGGLGEKGHHIFNAATRREVAKQFEAEHYEDHIQPLLASKR